jgi:hypothetical protein
MKIVDYDQTKGQAFQGDVAIIPIPAGIPVSTFDEIKPKDGKLILQEGELTGHHHHIVSRNFKPTGAENVDPVLHVRDTRLRAKFSGVSNSHPAATARMYRDPSVGDAMQSAGILARTDLMVGVLVVEGGPVTIVHQEHDGIRCRPGNYYIGRQVESVGADERTVAD